jgi:hypothetical protein
VDTSLLAQELEPLNAQIEEARAKVAVLEGDLRVVEAELDTFSADKQRFDALREVCDALDKLGALGAGAMFWTGVAQIDAVDGHQQRAREQVTRFEGLIRGVQERQQALKQQIDERQEQLDYLFEEVHDAYIREERRQEEFTIEREISPVPHSSMVMPWTTVSESERLFRRTLLISLFWCLLFGIVIPRINVPIPDRVAMVVEIPERLAMLVKKEPPRPEPQPRRKQEVAKADAPKPDKSAKAAKSEKTEPAGGTKVAKAKPSPGGGGGGSPDARQKARSTGVLAFKGSFDDLMDEVPVARLGTEARLNKNSKQVDGQAVAHRSLVASQALSGGSGGISNFGVSRNLGNGGSGGGIGFGKGGGRGSGNGTGYGDGSGNGYGGSGKIKSTVAGLTEEAGRPLSDGPGPGRTDEEIQIVFDRYKATLYRIYNRKLREDPTLRGKLLLRLTIEPGGDVSMCKAESTDLASPELVAQIVERVKRFNFGPKEGVPKTTILYPIDFLPAG